MVSDIPGLPDNAEASVKCSKCGNTILLGGHSKSGVYDGTDSSGSTTCDVCSQRVSLSETTSEVPKAARKSNSSNEDF